MAHPAASFVWFLDEPGCKSEEVQRQWAPAPELYAIKPAWNQACSSRPYPSLLIAFPGVELLADTSDRSPCRSLSSDAFDPCMRQSARFPVMSSIHQDALKSKHCLNPLRNIK